MHKSNYFGPKYTSVVSTIIELTDPRSCMIARFLGILFGQWQTSSKISISWNQSTSSSSSNPSKVKGRASRKAFVVFQSSFIRAGVNRLILNNNLWKHIYNFKLEKKILAYLNCLGLCAENELGSLETTL